MKKYFLFLPLFVAMMTACSSDDPIADEPAVPENPVEKPADEPVPDVSNWTLTQKIELTDAEKAVVKDFNQFSHELMSKVSDIRQGDYCCSPASISIYMSMFANAAGGQSRKQILSALHVEDLATVNMLNAKLMHYLPCEENGSALNINNRFWVADRHTVNPDFTSTIQDVYNGNVEYVDFSKSTTVPAINKWVYNNTKGLINSILGGDWTDYIGLDMASANTVYFKGKWDDAFEAQNTRNGVFHGTKDAQDVKMMRQKTKTWYSKNDKFQLVVKKFTYWSNQVEFYLPAEDLKPAEFTALLTPEMQDNLYSSGESYNVTLSLPIYKSESEVDLNDAISAMGINPSNVDLSSMGLPASPLQTLHKTSMKFDEEGAEFAAVTGFMVGANGQEIKPKNVTVNFDRPFLYIIRNNKTGMILMAGTVCNVK